MADALKNFAYSTVATAPSPPTTGTSLVVAAGEGSRYPPVPFDAVVWPANVIPLPSNAEVVRVTQIATDTLTIVRGAEGSSARSVVTGDQIGANITAPFLGAGLVNQRPSYDLKVPAGHSLVASGEYEIGAGVEIRVDADADLRIL